ENQEIVRLAEVADAQIEAAGLRFEKLSEVVEHEQEVERAVSMLTQLSEKLVSVHALASLAAVIEEINTVSDMIRHLTEEAVVNLEEELAGMFEAKKAELRGQELEG